MSPDVSLRPMNLEDLPFLLEIRNHSSTRSQLENDKEFSLKECQSWFKKLPYPWFIIQDQFGNRIGYLRTKGDAIGVDIHPNHRRKGFAKAAFDNYLKDKKFACLEVFEDNFAINLYKKLGFKKKGKKKIIRGRNYIYMEYKR